MRSLVLLSSSSIVVAACGSSPAPTPSDPTSKQSEAPSTAPAQTSEPPAKHAPAGQPKVVDGDTIFEHVKGDLFACYQKGKKAAPKMESGKLTLHASVEKDGKVSCVIPTDDTGLTQEVEDCMAARVGKETFEPGPAPWTFEIPVVVKSGKLSLGEDETTVAEILNVETHGLGDDAHEVAESLLPKFQKCVLGAEKNEGMRVLHVGGRVGRDGRVTCAIATSPTPMPEEMRECAATALENARFSAPKKGEGLISIPLKLMARRK